MKFYVAGSIEDRQYIKFVQKKLIASGHEITRDWTANFKKDDCEESQRDIGGVEKCDAFLGMFRSNHRIYRGSLAELGAAIAYGKRVYVVGHAADDCVFVHHPLVTVFSTFREFWKEVIE